MNECSCNCEAKLQAMLNSQNVGLMNKIYQSLGIVLVCSASAAIGVLVCKMIGG